MENTIGDRIKAERKAQSITQVDIAKAAGTSRAAVSQWEVGTSKGLKPENLILVAKALGVTAEWLTFGSKYPKFTNNLQSSSPTEPAPALNLSAVEFAFEAIRRNVNWKDREADSVGAEVKIFDLLYRYYIVSLEDGDDDDPSGIDPSDPTLSRLIKLSN